jgi:hypothetical protein
MRWLVLLVLLFVSCKSTRTLQPSDTRIHRTKQHQQEIDTLLAADAHNKKWARIYLHEIDMAMKNDDIQAYVFFVGEFEKIPLEIVPHHLRGEPGYAGELSVLELHFRLRWFDRAIQLYKEQTHQNK